MPQYILSTYCSIQLPESLIQVPAFQLPNNSNPSEFGPFEAHIASINQYFEENDDDLPELIPLEGSEDDTDDPDMSTEDEMEVLKALKHVRRRDDDEEDPPPVGVRTLGLSTPSQRAAKDKKTAHHRGPEKLASRMENTNIRIRDEK